MKKIFQKNKMIYLLLICCTISFLSVEAINITSNTISDIVEDVNPSIVNIDNRLNGKEIPEADSDFNSIESHSGTGTGVIIKKDGYILTNYHVVKGNGKIIVTLFDGKKFDAKLISHDSYSDLALIKIDSKDLDTIFLGDSDKLKVGEWVIAIGSPLGLEHTVTHGIISGIGRHIGASFGAAQGAFKYIQTDAVINPGNSGGPLLNLFGEVIGINTFIVEKNSKNLNFAIPSNYVKKITNELLEIGSIRHSYFGVKTTSMDEFNRFHKLENNKTGIYVIEVLPNSPAEESGVLPGDIIEKIDSINITTPTQIAEIIRNKKPGNKIQVRILRNMQIKNITVVLGTLPE